MIAETTDTLLLTDLKIYALTLIGEFDKNGGKGMTEVACVIQNRKAANKWWGHNERAICLYPYQFSCWNPGTNPDRVRILAFDQTSPTYALAENIARDATNGLLADTTNNATHYFNHITLPAIAWPKWYEGQDPCFIDEPHWFFDLSKTG